MKLPDRLKHIRIIRAAIYLVVGLFSYPGLVILNRIKIEGTGYLKKLPKNNVLFVSNHQTFCTGPVRCGVYYS